jgi:uncharacterized protein YbaR (Trm112 family)
MNTSFEEAHEDRLHDDHFEVGCPLCRHRMYLLQENGTPSVDVRIVNVDTDGKFAVVEILSPSHERQDIDGMCMCCVKDLHPLILPTQKDD